MTVMAERARCMLVFLCVIFRLTGIMCQATLSKKCPRYVLENTDFTCECQLPEGSNGTVKWPGHSDSGMLSVSDVQRAQNDTKYTCEWQGAEGETSSVNYTLLVAYGPKEENIRITSEVPFPTNGTRTMTLTCQVDDVYPEPEYTWREVVCDASDTEKICDFTPKPSEDDGKEVRCDVSRRYGTDLPREVLTTVANVQLNYPPSNPPQINLEVNGTDLLVRGDNLTCTISGGKPRMNRVEFSCTSPYLADLEDEVNTKDLTLTSPLTISSFSDSQEPMRCICSGVWSTQPDYYTLTDVAFYDVEHPAVINNITINGRNDYEVNIIGNINASALFTCYAFGRPAPREGNISEPGGVGFDPDRYTSGSWTEKWITEFTLLISNVTCKDMQRFVCNVSNGLGDERATDSVVLTVLCGPWEGPGSVVLNMTVEGVSFYLSAFPPPDNVTFYHLGEGSLDTNGTQVDSGRFNFSCEQDDIILYKANCTIVPIYVPWALLGKYRASVRNSLGDTDVFFSILTEVIPEGMQTDGIHMSAGAVAGTVIGAVIAVTIVVIVIFIVFHKVKAKREPHDYPGISEDTQGSPGMIQSENVPMQKMSPPHVSGSRLNPSLSSDVDISSSNNNGCSSEIRTMATPKHNGVTSTPIKGSTMTESDLGYAAFSSARRLDPVTTTGDMDYVEVVDSAKISIVENASALTTQMSGSSAPGTEPAEAAHQVEEPPVLANSCHNSAGDSSSGKNDDCDDTHDSVSPPDMAGEEEEGGGYASVEEVMPTKCGGGGCLQEALYAVSPPLHRRAEGKGSNQYSQVHVHWKGEDNQVEATTGGKNSDEIGQVSISELKHVRILGEECLSGENIYDMLCTDGKEPTPSCPEDPNYSHIGNFGFST